MNPDQLQRENAYLKLRNAQLQSDLTDIAAERDRLVQELERLQGRRQVRAAADPLSGGQ